MDLSINKIIHHLLWRLRNAKTCNVCTSFLLSQEQNLPYNGYINTLKKEGNYFVDRTKGDKKKYGKQLILENIYLSIPKGQAVAIIGGNGTGKSTLLKIIAGFIAPTGGTIQRKSDIQIGYVPEHFPEDIRFTLEDYLYHLGRIHGLSKDYLQNKIPVLLKLFHLEHADHSVIKTFQKE